MICGRRQPSGRPDAVMKPCLFISDADAEHRLFTTREPALQDADPFNPSALAGFLLLTSRRNRPSSTGTALSYLTPAVFTVFLAEGFPVFHEFWNFFVSCFQLSGKYRLPCVFPHSAEPHFLSEGNVSLG